MTNLPDNQKPEQPEAPEDPKEPQGDLEPEEKSLANPEEPEQPESPENPNELPENPEGEPDQMSRRKAKRLEKLEGLVERLKGPQSQPQRKTEGIDYRKMIEADDQVYDQLSKASQDYGQQQFNAGLEQASSIQFHTRLELDAPRIESKYPQFDKDASEFNPGLASAVNEWYLATVGFNPETGGVQNANVRYADFVEGIMDLADAMAGARATKTTENIAKQAANAGLRPDGSSAKPLNLNKAPEDMTDEELRAAAKASMPRDSRGRFAS
jgi:Predicted membrane protein